MWSGSFGAGPSRGGRGRAALLEEERRAAPCQLGILAGVDGGMD